MENRIKTNMLYVQTIKPHFSTEVLEIILVLKGSINIQKVERLVTVDEGEFTFINRHIVHSVQSEGAYILQTEIYLDQFKNIFDKMEYVEFLNNDELLTINRPLKTRLNEMVRELLVNQYYFEHLVHEPSEGSQRQFNENQLVQILFNSYQLIAHLKEEEAYVAEKLQARYYVVVQYVIENTDKKIVVEDILKELYMHPTYFSQFMKKIGGIPFKDFVQYRKLVMIEGYLLDSSLSMVEIANRVGIYDMKAFYKVFKKYFKKVPKQWREEISQLEDDYRVMHEPKVLEKFIETYPINRHLETTGSKLYKRLREMKQASCVHLEGVELLLDLYADMGNTFDPHYPVYRCFEDLMYEIYQVKAILHLVYPYKYLKYTEQEQLFMNAIQGIMSKCAVGKLKGLKISFVVPDEKALLDAEQLKNRVEQKIGNLSIKIVMALSL